MCSVDTWVHIQVSYDKLVSICGFATNNINEIPWIRIGVELFTRPFLPSPFSSRPYRKGLGTKLDSCTVASHRVHIVIRTKDALHTSCDISYYLLASFYPFFTLQNSSLSHADY